jgi:hypothetical protein
VTAATRSHAAALEALLADAVDYAGLFPPTALRLDEVVRRYTTYRRGPSAWALGRLVVRAAELPALLPVLSARPLPLAAEPPVAVSVLLGADLDADVRLVVEAAAASPLYRVASIEARAADVPGVDLVARAARDTAERLGTPLYVEVPLGDGTRPALAAVRQARLRAKARTGGVTAEAVPAPADLAAFLATCVAAGLAFKVTAGLHHAVRGAYPLTYEPGAPRATLHGFVNVCVAAGLLVSGRPSASAAAVLEETDAAAFRFGPDAVEWRDERIDLAAIRDSRELLVSFGSCSFEEPMADVCAWSAAEAEG